jgi:hypothetical protein
MLAANPTQIEGARIPWAYKRAKGVSQFDQGTLFQTHCNGANDISALYFQS